MKTMHWCLLSAVVVLLGVGSTFGDEAKKLKPDDEGFIRNWVVLDPIKVDDKVANNDEESCKEIIQKDYVKADAQPKDGDKVKVDDKELTWHAVQSKNYDLDLLETAAGKPADNVVFLGVAYVVADKDLEKVVLAIGSDDDSLWKVNGQEVIRVYASRGVEKDQDKSKPLTLKKGLNVVKFAVINGGGPSGAAARFLDKDGKPIKDLTILTAPPAP
jgi:hypothetical protein